MPSSETRPAIDLSRICQLQEKPQPFEPGEPLFWTDAHIARQMLASHLDPTADGASRRPETIERTTHWIATSVGLRPGGRSRLGGGQGSERSGAACRPARITNPTP